jgi:alkylation response protein AidB-like acyl-CoA dehydrogenase
VANTVLGYERGASTLSRYAAYKRDFDSVVSLAKRSDRGAGPVSDDPVARQKIAQAAIEVEILRLSSLRQLSALAKGRKPGPESSIQKLYYSEMGARLMTLANDLTGVFGQLARRSPYAPDGGRWGQRELASRGPLIFAGTNEIQRNIIAQKVLGLPRD